ncbi:MAG: DNA repair exonuclease [Oscillatoriales cyanobacterium SM2_1_8]|nr:DNA repair exonuclease [Oscillatoriales cyanobacterium SM2_1_8]
MRIVHLADLHLGFRAYHRLTDRGINRREADVFAAFREALDRTAALQPDAVLVAGDVFHVPRPSNYALVQSQAELLRFRQKCAAPVVMIAGNHESVRSADNRCILELLTAVPGVQVVTENPEAVTLANGQVRVVGLPHNSLSRLNTIDLRPDPQVPYNVLMLHGTVDSSRINDYGGYDVPADLLELPWDYVACGHYHTYTHLGRHAYYAGAIERTSNNIWQEATEAKGFVLFDLVSHQAHFQTLHKPRPTLDLPTVDAFGKDVAALNQELAANVAAADITDKLVRQKILNLPKSQQARLDARQIRQWQTQAVHYLLDARPPTATLSEAIAPDIAASQGLTATVAEYLRQRELPKDLDRLHFVERGLAYLAQTEES